MHLLDRETTLTRDAADPDRARVPVTNVYRNFSTVAFGGWTLASAIEAAQTHPEWRGALLTANACYVDGLSEGDAHIHARLLGRKRRTDFWRVEIYTDAAETNLAFTVDIVASLEREASESHESPPPITQPPEEFPVLNVKSGPEWIQTFEMRPISGKPFRNGDNPRSLSWMRFKDGRPLDRKGLAALCDTPMPRIFMISASRRLVSTFTLTFTICAEQAAFDAAGDGAVLIETDSDRILEGRFHQRARLWSAQGALLAISEQVAVYGRPLEG